MRGTLYAALAAALITAAGCTGAGDDEMTIGERLDQYTSFRLEADLSGLTEGQRRMLPLLIEAAGIMDDIFWEQAYGSPDSLLNALGDDRYRRFAAINYGPWDRLNGDD